MKSNLEFFKNEKLIKKQLIKINGGDGNDDHDGPKKPLKPQRLTGGTGTGGGSGTGTGS